MSDGVISFNVRYSFIIPIYNRPDELNELLESILHQSITDFEVIVVEDGSTITCQDVCQTYSCHFKLHYYEKPNSGPGPSRNYGVERAVGDYVIILDSDVVLPPDYLKNVDTFITSHSDISLFGGPDRAADTFTPVQKAISYSMTSFFTTGGIRGGKKKLDKFFPRSFNMIVLRKTFIEVSGFTPMRFGEDIDFSYRVCENGYKTSLIPDAWVWHKRRTDFDKFFRQVYNSGRARIDLSQRHPGTLRLVHLLPTLFTLGVTTLVVLALIFRMLNNAWWMWCLIPLVLYCILIFIHSSRQNHSTQIGILSVEAAFIQLFGYGIGFISALFCKPSSQNSSINSEQNGVEFNKKFYG